MIRSARMCALALVALSVGALGCSEEPKPAALPKPVAEAPKPAPIPETKPEPDAKPEPSTPEEIELARKAALLEGRHKDAYKYCKMAGIEAGKSDEQALLGCVLAACRLRDVEQAKAWSKGLSRSLKREANRVCSASKVAL